MKRRNGHKRSIEERYEEAEIRQEERNKLSDLEQINKLYENGFTAKRETARLKKRVAFFITLLPLNLSINLMIEQTCEGIMEKRC